MSDPTSRFDREWQMYVDGEFEDATGETIAVENPATGDPITEVTLGTATDADRAVAAADAAFDEFRWTSPGERAEMLYEIADRIEENKRELAELEVAENGKPIRQAMNDANNAINRVRYYAGGADKFYGETVTDSLDAVAKKIYEPYGVVGAIVPWNWPLVNSIDFPTMALVMGNTVVIKPSSETPLSTLRMAEIVDGVLPDGTFNVVPGRGSEVGNAITGHERVRKVAFVGSSDTGVRIIQSAAENLTPAMVELGAKNPAIVFPDADIEKAVAGVVTSTCKNNGEACTGSERLLVHEAIYEAFVEAVCTRFENLVVDDGMAEDTEVGPAVSEDQFETDRRMVDAAVEEGAEILAQAKVPESGDLDGGYWFPPTVLGNVDPGMEIAQEEVFGPVLAVMSFSDEEEAIELANGVDFGLADYLWTTDLERAHRLASRLEAGRIAINNSAGGELGLPHGGYKRSGIGRKNDFSDGLGEFVQAKAIKIDMTDDHPSL